MTAEMNKNFPISTKSTSIGRHFLNLFFDNTKFIYQYNSFIKEAEIRNSNTYVVKDLGTAKRIHIL